MTLKQAIQNAKRIECMIHVQDGAGHVVRISKKDALEASRPYWNDRSVEEIAGLGTSDDWPSWENEYGSIIAMQISDNTLSIGR